MTQCSTTISAYGGQAARALCTPAHHTLPFTGIDLFDVVIVALLAASVGALTLIASRKHP